jgi:hypothetical protein
MSDNILEALEALIAKIELQTEAIAALQLDQSIVNRIDVQPICCEDLPDYYDVDITTIQVGTGDPPEPYEDWEEYMDDLCLRAQTAVGNMRKAMFQIYDLAEIGTGTITLGVLLAILALIAAPWAIAAAILALLIGGSFEIGIVFLKQTLDALEEDLVCAIYTSETAEDAAIQIASVIDGSDLDDLSKSIVTKAWHNGLYNGVYDQTLTIDPGASGSCDCEEEALLWLQTSPTSPYNVLIVGDSITSKAEDTDKGYQTQNNGVSIYGYFSPSEDIVNFDVSFQIGMWDYSCSPGTNPVYVVQGQWADTSEGPWYNILNSSRTHEFSERCAWLPFTEELRGVTIPGGKVIRWQFSVQNFNWTMWYRDITLEEVTV